MDYARLSTEKVNPRTLRLDRLSPRQIVRLMNREDAQVLRAIQRAAPTLEHAVKRVVRAFQAGGRLILVGAGTSGRLGVIEAAECPPTFGSSPKLVRALMAGGDSAVFQSKEGSEDSAPQGSSGIKALRVRRKDVVVGIAASGVTPYVQAALKQAKARRASTVLLTCSPQAPANVADVRVVLETGPEVLAGSTRLKAGSACKMALNILTTASMVQIGKVYENRMVDLQPQSKKLVERGLRLIQELGGVSKEEAQSLFSAARGRVKVAIVMARKNMTYTQASSALLYAKGFLRRVL